MKAMRIAAVALLGLLGAGCAPRAPERELSSAKEREMTVGIVQREIRAGLTQDQVAAALGSPNIVTRDASGNETWIYDKVASEASYSTSDRYGTILILGGSSAQGATSKTQRTLTVIIKFDANSLVESFSYHASKF
jgi:outer membrane protein assembly factor BamE (lipoprotein component of BamABCDE complex)